MNSQVILYSEKELCHYAILTRISKVTIVWRFITWKRILSQTAIKLVLKKYLKEPAEVLGHLFALCTYIRFSYTEGSKATSISTQSLYILLPRGGSVTIVVETVVVVVGVAISG